MQWTRLEEANRFLRQQYRAEFNRRFAVAAVSQGVFVYRVESAINIGL